jgi:hemerythrin-like metal-binding protein
MPKPSAGPAEILRLQWRADYASGNELLDMQHRQLFTAINGLIDAKRAKSSRKVELLDELIMHVLQHFQDEEELLRGCGYDEYPLHVRNHARLIEAFLTLRHGMIAQTTSFDELLDFLASDVVDGHLLNADRLFFSALART